VVDDVPDLDDAEDLQDILSFKLTAALPDTQAEARQELEQVEKLLDKLEAIRGLDSKRDVLIRALKKLMADGRSALVFTGYSDTMVYLRDYLVDACGVVLRGWWCVLDGKQLAFRIQGAGDHGAASGSGKGARLYRRCKRGAEPPGCRCSGEF
jgi:hypothetical protein